jgi:DNA polymerase III subunit gamma/tau
LAYFSLYRRSRPQKFSEMTGQDHITRTLSNALSTQRLAHAYLFSGPRGTGKTTAAKILARAMNCVDYPSPEPCGKCPSCLNIGAGVSIDVIEMDAASNRGIDEIRELRERSRFASGESRFKVYIIDEAHMLTPEACNAFLKTLEEPPQNVVFILATTDPSRLPSTIVSRCQRFDFHLLTVSQIRERLELILKEEGWQADAEALILISRLADGSLRDALGTLEQCSAYGEEHITAEHVRIVTGATRASTIEALLKAAVENDLDSGLAVIEEVVFSGRDLNLFLRDFTFVLTRLLASCGGDVKNAQTNLHGFEELLSAHHNKIERNLLLDAVELLHSVSGELRHAHFPQYILEVSFVRLLRLLHGRLKPVENLFNAPALMPPEVSAPEESSVQPPVSLAETASAQPTPPSEPAAIKVETASAVKSDDSSEPMETEDRLPRLIEAWPRLLQELKKRQKSTAAWLEPAVPVESRGHLVRLAYAPEYEIHRERIMGDSHRKLVEELLSAFFRTPINLKTEISLTAERMPAAAAEPVSPACDLQAEIVKPKQGPSADDALKIFGGKFIDSQ